MWARRRSRRASSRTNSRTLVYRYQRMYKIPLTNAQARAQGLDMQVLARLIDEAALNQRARSMGLGVVGRRDRRGGAFRSAAAGRVGPVQPRPVQFGAARFGAHRGRRSSPSSAAFICVSRCNMRSLTGSTRRSRSSPRWSARSSKAATSTILSLPPTAAGDIPAPFRRERSKPSSTNASRAIAPRISRRRHPAGQPDVARQAQ